MSKIEDGGPAFPVVKDQYDYGYEKEMPKQVSPGMTLRDYFAAKAMQSLAMHEEYPPSRAAQTAYEYADAMLKARSQS